MDETELLRIDVETYLDFYQHRQQWQFTPWKTVKHGVIYGDHGQVIARFDDAEAQQAMSALYDRMLAPKFAEALLQAWDRIDHLTASSGG